MILKYSVFLFLIISCLGGIELNNTKSLNNHLFEQYLLAFNKKDLPLKMDRKAVFEILNNVDRFFEIKDSLRKFIPVELINNYPYSKFKSLYVLPEHDAIILVLILQEFVNEYDIRVVKNHLVTYDRNGVILDNQELAGVAIDAWEAYLEIGKDYTIKRKLYQRRISADKEEIKYAYLVETCYDYSISNVGMIENIKETKRIGYFEGDWTGYNFVKPIKE